MTPEAAVVPPGSLEEKIERLDELAAAPDQFSTQLLHAYVGCLDTCETCQALILTLGARTLLRQAILRHLRKKLADSSNEEDLSQTFYKLIQMRRDHPRLRVRINAMLTTLYEHFTVDLRRTVIETWRDEGGAEFTNRWLKAVTANPTLLDINQIASFWKSSHDWRAARLIAYKAPPEIISQFLPDIIKYCSVEFGWIVAQAAIRSTELDEACRILIKEKFPASYIYICAKLNDRLTHEEAMELIELIGSDDTRGLAIWSLGQLGMWDTLDAVRALGPKFAAKDEEALFARLRFRIDAN